MRLGYLVAALLASVLSADARRVSRARVQLSAAVSKHPVPGKRGSGAAIVLSRVKEDVSWLDLYLPHLAHFVYQNGDNATSGYDASGNTCGESIVYLTFIIDHYHLLPEEVVFAHAHRCAHMPCDQQVLFQSASWTPSVLCFIQDLQRCAAFHETPVLNQQDAVVPHISGMRSDCPCAFRESWHLKDKAAAVSRLQWGRHAFANLRHANMSCPQHWTCPVPMRWKRYVPGGALEMHVARRYLTLVTSPAWIRLESPGWSVRLSTSL